MRRSDLSIKRLCIFFLLSLGCLLSGCDGLGSSRQVIDRALHYDKSGAIRFFFNLDSSQEVTPLPEYIQIKYVDQLKIKEWMEEDRYRETIKYLGSIWGSDVDGFRKLGRKKISESESDYLDRVQSYIPTHNALIPNRLGEIKYVDLRQQYRMEVWKKYPMELAENKIDKDDLILWVSIFGNALSNADLHFDFSGLGEASFVFQIKQPSDLLAEAVSFGDGKSKFIAKKEMVIIWKQGNLKKEHRSLTILGKYKAKEWVSPNLRTSKKLTQAYRDWLVSEIWWETHRQVDFYIDNQGLAHFENEQQLFDEAKNPSIIFTGTQFEDGDNSSYRPRANQKILNAKDQQLEDRRKFRAW